MTSLMMEGRLDFEAQEIWKAVTNQCQHADALTTGESLYVLERRTDNLLVMVEHIQSLECKLIGLSNTRQQFGTFKSILEGAVAHPLNDKYLYTDGATSLVYTNKLGNNFLVVLSYLRNVTHLRNTQTDPSTVHESYLNPELLHAYRVHVYPYNLHA